MVDLDLTAPQSTLIPEEPKGLTQLRGLVVDDNEDMRFLSGSLLMAEGMQIEYASSGQQAVEKAGSTRYDFVLMDVSMPNGMDGLEATRQIRKLGATMPIVGVTGRVLPEDKKQCFQAGMTSWIAKPYDSTALVDMIQKLL